MKPSISNSILARLLLAAASLALVCLVALASAAQTGTKKAAASDAKARTFATPQEAADAPIEAAEKYDFSALEVILRPGARDVIETGEPVRDREQVAEFVKTAREKKTVVVDRRSKEPGVRATKAVNPENEGTKAAAHYRLTLAPGEKKVVRLRLSNVAPDDFAWSKGKAASPLAAISRRRCKPDERGR